MIFIILSTFNFVIIYFQGSELQTEFFSWTLQNSCLNWKSFIFSNFRQVLKFILKTWIRHFCFVLRTHFCWFDWNLESILSFCLLLQKLIFFYLKSTIFLLGMNYMQAQNFYTFVKTFNSIFLSCLKKKNVCWNQITQTDRL